MSSASFESTIDLAAGPSTRAVIVLFWLHAVPLTILIFALPPGPPLIAVALGMGTSWLWTRRHRSFGYGPRALTRLTWHAEGKWTLRTAAGTTLEGELLGSSVVVGPLTLLNFRIDGGGRQTRVLLGDELEEASLRQLHARLRMLAST